MKKITNLLKTIPYMVIFAVIAIAAGYCIPQTYYQYFDTTEYYQIKNPVEIKEEQVFACSQIDAYIDRVSLIDGQGDAIVNLTLIREDMDGALDRVKSINRRITITKGSGVIITHWEVPCEIKPGTYYFDGVVEYEVRGVKKNTSFKTELFNVEEINDPS